MVSQLHFVPNLILKKREFLCLSIKLLCVQNTKCLSLDLKQAKEPANILVQRSFTTRNTTFMHLVLCISLQGSSNLTVLKLYQAMKIRDK